LLIAASFNCVYHNDFNSGFLTLQVRERMGRKFYVRNRFIVRITLDDFKNFENLPLSCLAVEFNHYVEERPESFVFFAFRTPQVVPENSVVKLVFNAVIFELELLFKN